MMLSKAEPTCKHCEFIEKTFGAILKSKDSTNREYWIMTEVFVYLHGSDICDKNKNNSLIHKKNGKSNSN